MNTDLFNLAFLEAHPEIKSKIMRKIRRPKVIVMALKPKYAKAIYEGRKNWEFRKAPPPLFHTIYIYESAPVSAINRTISPRAIFAYTPLVTTLSRISSPNTTVI